MYRLEMNDNKIDGAITLAHALELVEDCKATMVRNNKVVFRLDSGACTIELAPYVRRVDWIVFLREYQNRTYAYIGECVGISRQGVRSAYLKYVQDTKKANIMGDY